jgi:hypothetical protein
MLGTIAAFLSYSGMRYTSYNQMRQEEETSILAHQQHEQLERADREINELQTMNQAILKSLDQIKHSGKTVTFGTLNPSDRQSIDEIKSAQLKLDTRLSTLETSIMASPEKALAVPMLKQQIDSLQDRTHNDLEGIRGEIGRLFTLTQWFIALMFTIALGMFGLAFNIRKHTAASSSER